MFASCITQTYMCRSVTKLQMNLLHSSRDILTLTCGMFCYHPYDNTVVIAHCSIIVLVYVANTQATLLTTCRCGSELHIFTMRPCSSELTCGTGPTSRITQRRDANDVIFAPLISNPATGSKITQSPVTNIKYE